MIRVMIAEDSASARVLLQHVLEDDGRFEVAGAAENGKAAVEMAERLRPDVILMDVYMPHVDGLEATRQIMEKVPTPIVMTSASFTSDETALTFAALEAGALTIVEKPMRPSDPDFPRAAGHLALTLRMMSEVRVVRRWPRRAPAPPPAPPIALDRRIDALAIGVSTGGPNVLAEILGSLPADLGFPVFVVQHMALGFMDGFVRWLAKKTVLKVKVAEVNEWVRRGTIYIAPDDAHLLVEPGGRISLSGDAAEDGFRPSASRLFRSVAASYGGSAMGVILTGMGHDGASGLLALRRAGGLTVAQDEASCVVFGMPGEAIRLGAAEQILPPPGIADLIRSLARAGGRT